eukprot:TRINITY_DN9815_c0_g1_i1.p1 TRINITY_DN9815_c0_g1~~TRINITY_DN9815_c0_g1_i1.p1  ORF type:complete len:398 (-),score=72.66 TRINITY_DN9815_c0_g1_i1:170-1363(-)
MLTRVSSRSLVRAFSVVDNLASKAWQIVMDEKENLAKASRNLSHNKFDVNDAVDNVSDIFNLGLYIPKPQIDNQLAKLHTMFQSRASTGQCLIVYGPNQCGKSTALVNLLRDLFGVMYIKISKEFNPMMAFPFLFNELADWKNIYRRNAVVGSEVFKILMSCSRDVAEMMNGNEVYAGGIKHIIRPIVVLEHATLLGDPEQVMSYAQSFMAVGANVVLMISDGNVLAYQEASHVGSRSDTVICCPETDFDSLEQAGEFGEFLKGIIETPIIDAALYEYFDQCGGKILKQFSHGLKLDMTREELNEAFIEFVARLIENAIKKDCQREQIFDIVKENVLEEKFNKDGRLVIRTALIPQDNEIISKMVKAEFLWTESIGEDIDAVIVPKFLVKYFQCKKR